MEKEDVGVDSMVSKAFKTCLLLIEKMVKHGYLRQINQEDVGKIISKYIGADPRTIEKYVRVCVQWKLLTAHPVNKNVYYINLLKADKQIKEVFNRPMKQLTLPEARS